MVITERQFALIHNDAYLVGTRNLEGTIFKNTLTYLQDFIRERNIESLQPIHQKIENMLQWGKINELLESTGKSPDEVLNSVLFGVLLNHIYREIGDLDAHKKTAQKSVIISGGWTNADGGHAMVYEFEKVENGDLIFMVHNTGAGLEFHKKVSQEDKSRYSPIKAYRIPAAKIDKANLKQFIAELIKPNLRLKNEEYSEERLYLEVLPKIAQCGGEEVDPFQYTRQDSLTAGQRSGSCAEKIFTFSDRAWLPR